MTSGTSAPCLPAPHSRDHPSSLGGSLNPPSRASATSCQTHGEEEEGVKRALLEPGPVPTDLSSVAGI